MARTLSKEPNHDHFWIEDGVLFETYSTLRGLRWRKRFDVPGMRDSDHLSDHSISYIEARYLDPELDERFDLIADYMEYYTDFVWKKALLSCKATGPLGIIHMSHPYDAKTIIKMYNYTGSLLYTTKESKDAEFFTIEDVAPMTLEEWECENLKTTNDR